MTGVQTCALPIYQGFFISYRFPFVIGDFAPGSAAKDSGMQKGDKIVKVGVKMTPYYNDFLAEISQYANQKVVVSVVRENDTLPFTIQLSDDAKLGVYVDGNVLESETQTYTFAEAIPQGFNKTGKELSDYWKQLKIVFNPKNKAYDSLGGFITIGSIFPDAFNWVEFWRLTAFLLIAGS